MIRTVHRAFATAALVLALVLPGASLSDAQPADREDGKAEASDSTDGTKTGAGESKSENKNKPRSKPKKEKLFDFTALKLDGESRMPQLLYFLQRASEELERASLKKRSFVPELIRSLDEDAL